LDRLEWHGVAGRSAIGPPKLFGRRAAVLIEVPQRLAEAQHPFGAVGENEPAVANPSPGERSALEPVSNERNGNVQPLGRRFIAQEVLLVEASSSRAWRSARSSAVRPAFAISRSSPGSVSTSADVTKAPPSSSPLT
jgi:hypothetical protein